MSNSSVLNHWCVGAHRGRELCVKTVNQLPGGDTTTTWLAYRYSGVALGAEGSCATLEVHK
jgi:hypothetical protein